MSDQYNKSLSKNRQSYYFQGRAFEKENQLEKAINSYLDYSTTLSIEDQHIPHQWISKLYERLGNKEKSLIHLELYSRGEKDAKKSEIYKEIGEEYESMGNHEKALDFYLKATNKNNQIGLKTRISKLQKLTDYNEKL
jgi:tetratricopeptide (TPR) repeat protein